MGDNITNWYSKVKNKGMKRDKNFKSHMIEPCSMIALIGQSGAGKSTALIEFISRTPDKFYEIHLFSGSGSATTEPLYVMLKDHIKETQTYDDIADFPDLESLEDKNIERLMIFDDWLQLGKKGLDKLAKYATCGRKSGCTCIFQSQNYTSIPKVISRNIHYFWIFCINDTRSIETICKNHSTGLSVQEMKDLHKHITSEPRSFFHIDMRGNNLRKNFTDIIEKA
jgi:hypothetical protein